MAKPIPEEPPHRRRRHLVKRYAGSRLYDFASLTYVTPEHLRGLRDEGIEVVVIDPENGSDITDEILRGP